MDGRRRSKACLRIDPLQRLDRDGFVANEIDRAPDDAAFTELVDEEAAAGERGAVCGHLFVGGLRTTTEANEGGVKPETKEGGTRRIHE